MPDQTQATEANLTAKQKRELLMDAAKRRRAEEDEPQKGPLENQVQPIAVRLSSAKGTEYSALND